MALIAVGLFGLAMVPESLPLHRIIVPMALVGIGMAGFSSPNTSAAMGVVSMDMLGIAAAVLATMRSLGQSVSMAALGGIAAHELGRDGGRVILGGDASGADAAAYLSGYRTAMLVGSAIAVIRMLVSLTRGRRPRRLPDPRTSPPSGTRAEAATGHRCTSLSGWPSSP
ncbi:MAG: hypothetical protein R2878_12195 [Thermoleophilia bacterium]